jgi:hypothetical protein
MASQSPDRHPRQSTSSDREILERHYRGLDGGAAGVRRGAPAPVLQPENAVDLGVSAGEVGNNNLGLSAFNVTA